MTIEGKSQMPSFSPEDEKEAQKELNSLRKRLRGNINRAIKATRKGPIFRTGFGSKTLWDWLQLLSALAIPIAIALGTAWFSYQQSQASDLASSVQHQTDLQIATDQQQEATLQIYLDRMSDLLLSHKLGESKSGDAVSLIAKERTLTILRILQGKRNAIVLQFLRDAHLIGMKSVVIDLSGTNLANDDLSDGNLKAIYLYETVLRGVNLRHADVRGADLGDADLRSAQLRNTNLEGADLRSARLTKGQLLYVSSFHIVILPDGSIPPVIHSDSQPAFKIIINSAQDTYTYNGYRAKSGNHFVIVDASFLNQSSNIQTLKGQVFDLHDNTGKHYTESQASNPGQSFVINPRDSITTETAFEVPNSQCQFFLTFLGGSNIVSDWTISGSLCS